MKNRNNIFLKWMIGIGMLLAVAQGAWAGCSGTVYFQAPESWNSVYVAPENGTAKTFAKDATTGFYIINLDKLGAEAYVQYFNIGNAAKAPLELIGANKWIVEEQYDANKIANAKTFSCPGAGETIYIYENPSRPGMTVLGTTPPNAKYVHFLVPPDDATWMSAVPMISMDGGKTGIAMTADALRCGWYTYVWFGNEPTDEVVFYKDSDVDRQFAIGLELWNPDASTNVSPIPLKSLFDLFNDPSLLSATGDQHLYFIPDDSYWPPEDEKTYMDNNGFSPTDPITVDGKCEYTLAALIYDTDPSLHPAFSCFVDGGQGADAYDRDCQEGAGGVDKATARAALQKCLGVTGGMVEPTLTNGKPKLTAKGKSCFLTDELFAQMFTQTDGVNEMSCYDMPFTRSSDGRWEFDSDKFVNVLSNGDTVRGGFYPVERTTDADIVQGTPVPAARTKHPAQGPVSLFPWMLSTDNAENIPLFDLMCKGEGWNDKNAQDCEGHFKDGNDWKEFKYYGVEIGDNNPIWCWGNYCLTDVPNTWPTFVKDTETPMARTKEGAEPRWASGNYGDGKSSGTEGRNQHFCFESHANFKYKEGLRFNFRGDDDIWVFIAGKLAVDLGGTHLAAPAYVNLDQVTDAAGNALKVGETYDIDIFFCDRRTTMSNVRITTNMYIQQQIDFDKNVVESKDGKTEYQLCYMASGDGSCASKVLGGEKQAKPKCGDELDNGGINITYILMNKRGSFIDTLENGKVSYGGIDLTHPGRPVVSKNKEDYRGLVPGSYKLIAEVNKSKVTWSITVSGNLAVVYQNGVYEDEDTGARENYEFVGMAMAGTRIPLYVTSLIDPGDGSALELEYAGAAGMEYTLEPTGIAGLTLYETNDPLDTIPLNPALARTVGESGVDTIWATADLSMMLAAQQTFNVRVAGNATDKPAVINFYAPQIRFVADSTSLVQVMGDAEDDYRWVSSVYDFFLVAFAPNADGNGWDICTTCNFDLYVGNLMSEQVNIVSGGSIVNGRATIQVSSTKEYLETGATIHVTGVNPDLISATYSPAYFKKPPVPVPVLCDLFDAQGKVSEMDMNIPGEYFNKSTEYQDGIADSIVVYYHRPIHKDSLPDSIWVLWDNNGQDSVRVSADVIKSGFTTPTDTNPDYFQPVLKVGGQSFSKDVKTGGIGRVVSYATFRDKRKGAMVTVSDPFSTNITDRIAPVILSARVKAESDDYDQLTIKLSEPVRLLTTDDALQKASFSYYLNSALSLPEGDRYKSGVSSMNTPAVSEEIMLRFYSGDANVPTPHVGDYIRFRADQDLWTDTVSVELAPGRDTIPAAAIDVAWNHPTNYNETSRAPSKWVQIAGEAKIKVESVNFTNVSPELINPETTSPISVIPVLTTDDLEKVIAKLTDSLHYRPIGQYAQTDMGAIINSDTNFVKNVDKSKVYFHYDISYFTNLGNFVAHQSGKISCTDSTYFGQGKDCVSNPRNFFIAWNMLSSKNRLVGAGAYISKFESYVHLDNFGTKAKKEKTESVGVSRARAKPSLVR